LSNIGTIQEWNRVFIMIGMLSGGIIIGVTTIENTGENIIFFGMLALAFIIPSTILQIKYEIKPKQTLEDKHHV